VLATERKEIGLDTFENSKSAILVDKLKSGQGTPKIRFDSKLTFDKSENCFLGQYRHITIQ